MTEPNTTKAGARTQTDEAAKDWGRSIGRMSAIYGEPIPTAKGTGLRGRLRAEFEAGAQETRQAAINRYIVSKLVNTVLEAGRAS